MSEEEIGNGPVDTRVVSFYSSPLKAKNEVFEKPEDIWVTGVKYFEYCKNNPIKTEQPNFRNGGAIELDKPRAMSIEGFCTYLGIPLSKWKRYATDKRFEHLHEVCEYVEQVIYAQLFELAAVRELDSAIIIRKLGLAEKKEETITLEQPILNFTPIPNTQEIDLQASSIRDDVKQIEDKPLFDDDELSES
jgi:hypothetical protein